MSGKRFGHVVAVLAALLCLAVVPGQGPMLHAEDAAAPSADARPPEPREFLSLAPDGKTVRIILISAYNGVNYGMNFNGHAKGGARFVLPVGSEVEVAFTNRSPVPHSVVVVERPQVKKLQMGDPVCAGASTTNPVRGTTGAKGEVFRFKVTEPGDFAFACGFPSHAANGHWIGLEVSETAKVPSLQFGDGKPWSPAP